MCCNRLSRSASAWLATTRRVTPGRPPAPEESSDCGHHLFGPFVLLLGFGADDACVRVPVEQSERDLVQRRLRGTYLGEDVDAVAVVLDHAFDPADLPFDPGQPREVMGVRHRRFPIHGVQFHPESFLTDGGIDLLKNFLAL